MISFVLHCEPPKHTAQGSSTILKNFKTGKFFIGKKANSKAVQDKNYLLAMLMPYQPKKPMEGALKLEIDLFYSWRKSEPKKNRAKGQMPITTRPDVDNLVKQILDCFTRLAFWVDDAQVFDLHITKFYTDTPMMRVKITEYNQ